MARYQGSVVSESVANIGSRSSDQGSILVQDILMRASRTVPLLIVINAVDWTSCVMVVKGNIP